MLNNRPLSWLNVTRRSSFVALAIVLASCIPAGNAECGTIELFSRSVGAGGTTYGELARLTSQLSNDLYASADSSSSSVVQDRIRYAARTAQDVTTVIQSGQSRDIIEFQIDVLAEALEEVLSTRC